MYIKKITLKNFKTFENFSFNLSDAFNVITGGNETGKTTVLESLLFLFDYKLKNMTNLIHGHAKYLTVEAILAGEAETSILKRFLDDKNNEKFYLDNIEISKEDYCEKLKLINFNLIKNKEELNASIKDSILLIGEEIMSKMRLAEIIEMLSELINISKNNQIIAALLDVKLTKLIEEKLIDETKITIYDLNTLLSIFY